jgi:HEAT repeat protein
MTKKPEKFRAAVIAMAGTIAISLVSKLPSDAAPPTKGAVNAAKKGAKSASSASPSKSDQAKSILSDLQSLDHPERKIQSGPPGWQEERQAATESTQHHIHDDEAKLTSLGSSIAPVLAEGLNSPNRDVAESCTKVLGQFGRDSVEPVIAIVKKYGVIPQAVSTFKQIGSDALPPLIVMLKSSDKIESMTALTIMDSILTPKAGFRLRHHPSGTYGMAIQFLGASNFGGNNQSVVLSGLQVEQICSMSTSDASTKFKQQFADLLGKIGLRSPKVAIKLASFVSNEEQPEVREAAIAALGNVVNQNHDAVNEYFDTFLKVLAKDDYPGCRAEAASALGRIPSAASKSVPALGMSLKDGDPEVTAASIQALSSLGEQASGALPDLLKFVQDSQDVISQHRAMTAIANMKGAALPALPYVLKCLSGDNPQLRTGALNVVVNLGPAASSAVPILISMLSDAQVRTSAVRALAAIGPAASAAIPALKELAHSNQVEHLNTRLVQQALQKITGEGGDPRDGIPENMMRTIVRPPTLPIQSPNASSI